MISDLVQLRPQTSTVKYFYQDLKDSHNMINIVDFIIVVNPIVCTQIEKGNFFGSKV